MTNHSLAAERKAKKAFKGAASASETQALGGEEAARQGPIGDNANAAAGELL
jgi:hypothetical protein